MDFSKKILVGITGYTNKHWQDKLKEVEKFKIKKIALFLERFKTLQRKSIYSALLESKIENIPVVHIRHDMTRDELVFLSKNFGSRYFTIHESSFNILSRWSGFYKNLYMEMNFDNFIPHSVNVRKIGGFCVDLSHFKAEEEKWSKEFEYILRRKDIHKYFGCNHLNGYSYPRNKDVHTPNGLRDFKYLKTLPKFLFSSNIGLEMYNSISQQLKYKDYIVKLLDEKFNKK